MSEPIHQEIDFPATPQQVYKALTTSDVFSRVTGGAPTVIDPENGGSFSCFGGMITGRNVELVPNERIVQAWRAGNWEPGVYSIAKYELKAQGDETRLVLDHAGFPPESREHLEAGWAANYWEPLRKHLSS
jgi:uncharacterized protein YndB with AHSA1/START domain